MSRILRGVHASAAAPAEIDTVERLAADPARRPRHGALADALRHGHEQGYADGHRLGVAEGRDAGRREALEEFRALLAPALGGLEQARRDLDRRDAVALADVEAQVVALAAELAEALLGRELAAVDAPARDALRRALRLAPDRGELVARLHPADVELVAAGPDPAPGRALVLVADPDVERGGCVVEVGACTIDAQLGPALSRARQALGLDPAAGPA